MRLVIKGSMCDLNTYINYERMNRFAANKIKREETERVVWECKAQKLKPIAEDNYPVFMIYTWYCKDKKKDKSNISSMGRKVIEDGLVEAGILKNDGWNLIEGFEDHFEIDSENERVEVEIL